MSSTRVIFQTGPISLRDQALMDRPQVALVLDHPRGLEVRPLVQGGRLRVGRDAPADVVVADPSISKEHATFHFDGERVYVEDLGSTNGTTVDGAPVPSRGRAELTADGEARLGLMRVSLYQRPNPAPVDDALEDLLSQIDTELARCRYSGRTATVALLDGADPVALRRSLRAFEVSAVHSGELSILLLPETSVQEAESRAEGWIREKVRVVLAQLPHQEATAAALVAALLRVPRTKPLQILPNGHRAVTPVLVDPQGRSQVIAASAAMQEVLRLTRRLAPTDLPVVLQGPTGVGKEVIAQAIHAWSLRSGGPLIALNCGALPSTLLMSELFGNEKGAFTDATNRRAGLLESASTGTLFLDEVAELSPEAQAALLRALETKRIRRVGGTQDLSIDLRLVAASHVDLEQAVQQGKFREDLYHRIAGDTLFIPPLAERPDDILPLAELFLRNSPRPNLTLSAAAQNALLRHPWPGNARQLRNAIERAAALATEREVRAEDLLALKHRPTKAEPGATVSDLRSAVADYERGLIERALERNGGKRKLAAVELGLPERTLSHRMSVLGMV